MMHTISIVLVAVVGLQHIGFLWLEMFAWTTTAPKVFRGYSPDFFPKTKAMAANQGLYNGFLAAGLFWSLLIENQEWANNIAMFFLSCVLVAAVYGAYSVSIRILMVQGTPAAIALATLLLL